MTWMRFELTPFRTDALSQRLKPLGHHVYKFDITLKYLFFFLLY